MSETEETKAEAPNSQELVENAVKFLINPRIAASPLSQKRAFLKSKGLTDVQIDEACAKAGINQNQEFPMPLTPGTTVGLYQARNRGNWLSSVKDLANLIVVFGGAAYGLAYVWKNFIRPWLYNEGRDEEKNKLSLTLDRLTSSIASLEVALADQKLILERILCKSEAIEDNNNGRKESQDIKSEIISLKGLLLSTSRFPSHPLVAAPSSSTYTLPEWQFKQQDPLQNGEETSDPTVEKSLPLTEPDLVPNSNHEHTDENVSSN